MKKVSTQMAGGVKTNNPDAEDIAPGGNWGWVIVFASFMIHFIMDGITYSMSEIYLRPMMEILRSDRGHVSAIFAMLPAITLTSGVIVTVFVNTYGCRKVTIIGACIAALGFAASSLYANIWFYFITISVIGGIGFGLIYLPAIASVNVYFGKKAPFAVGIAVCGSGVGTVVFPWLLPYIINSPIWLGYNGGLRVESALIFVCVIFGMLMRPLPKEASEQRRVEKAKQKADKAQASISSAVIIDEQRSQLLPDPESIPLQEMNAMTRETVVVVVDSDDQHPSDHRISFSDLKKNKSSDELTTLSESVEYVVPQTPIETIVVVTPEDAVYQGSLHHIPLYNKNIDKYHESINQSNSSTDKNLKEIPKQSCTDKLQKYLNFKLLKDRSFALFVVSNFITSLGFNVPYNFANDLAIDANVIESRRHWIIMSIGVANCFGRVIIGYAANRKWVNRLILYNITLIIAGMATMAAPYCGSIVYSHMIYASLFGFFTGGCVGLTSVIVAEMVDEQNLNDGLGLVYFFQGIATSMGSPIVGAMRDAFSPYSQPYLWPYLIFGGWIVLSAVILFEIPLRNRRKKRHLQQLTKDQLDKGVISNAKQNLSTEEQRQQL